MLAKITKDLKTNTRACLTGLLLTFTALPVMAGSITDAGSPHDFSQSLWTGGEICIACHTPHNANASVTEAPLWNHDLSVESYTLYDSPTLDATTVQPAGTSKLCLSCHDGTVALDNSAQGQKMTGTSAIGLDGLSNDHPISFAYTSTLATTDGALHNPATTQVTIGSGNDTKSGTITDVMLIGGQVQCATCHDVHNKFTDGGTSLLRVSNAGSGLCLTCHNK